MAKTYTIGELIKELQRAVIVDELDWESEVLNWELAPVKLTVVPNSESEGLRTPGHAVIE